MINVTTVNVACSNTGTFLVVKLREVIGTQTMIFIPADIALQYLKAFPPPRGRTFILPISPAINAEDKDAYGGHWITSIRAEQYGNAQMLHCTTASGDALQVYLPFECHARMAFYFAAHKSQLVDEEVTA